MADVDLATSLLRTNKYTNRVGKFQKVSLYVTDRQKDRHTKPGKDKSYAHLQYCTSTPAHPPQKLIWRSLSSQHHRIKTHGTVMVVLYTHRRFITPQILCTAFRKCWLQPAASQRCRMLSGRQDPQRWTYSLPNMQCDHHLRVPAPLARLGMGGRIRITMRFMHCLVVGVSD